MVKFGTLGLLPKNVDSPHTFTISNYLFVFQISLTENIHLSKCITLSLFAPGR